MMENAPRSGELAAQEIERLKDEAHFWEQQAIERQEEVERLTKDNLRMEVENRHYNDAIEAQDALQAEVELLRNRVHVLQGQLDDSAAEVKRLRQGENALRRELHTAYEERKEAEAEVERLQGIIDRDNGAVEGLSWDLGVARKEVERLQAVVNNRNARIEKLEDLLGEDQAEVERLTAWKNAAESGGGAGVRAARAEEMLRHYIDRYGTAVIDDNS